MKARCKVLLDYLQTANRNHPRSRWELRMLTGKPDRAIRKEIEELRKQGHKICSDSHGKGYWVAKNESDYKKFRKEYMGRVNSMLGTVKAMDESVEVW